MRVSNNALSLLLSGQFSELYALSAIDLLNSCDHKAIVDLCSSPRFLDDFRLMFIDPISQENIINACVISSGVIISQSSADAILVNSATKKIKCPITQNEISKNISGTGRAYVLLPQVDTIISCFEQLALGIKKSSSSVSETDVPFLDEGSITLSVSKRRIKIQVDFFEEGSQNYQALVNFLSLVFPGAEIKPDWVGYTMDEHNFGHAWISDYHRSFCLNFWFPNSTEMKKTRRMFSDYHIEQVVHLFLSISHWPSMVNDVPLARDWSYSCLDEERSLVIIDHISTPFWKMLLSIHEFLVFTHRTAIQLKFNIVNVPRESTLCMQSSRITSSNFFRPSESSSEIGVPHDQPGI